MAAWPFLIGLVLLAAAALNGGRSRNAGGERHWWWVSAALACCGLRFWIEAAGFAFAGETAGVERLAGAVALGLLGAGTRAGAARRCFAALLGIGAGWTASGIVGGAWMAAATTVGLAWPLVRGSARRVDARMTIELAAWGILGGCLGDIGLSASLVSSGLVETAATVWSRVAVAAALAAAVVVARRAWLTLDEAGEDAAGRPGHIHGFWSREWVVLGALALAVLETGGHIWLERDARRGLLAAARLIAAGLDPEKVDSLTGRPEDAANPVHAQFYAALTSAGRQMSSAVSAYLAAERGGKLVYLAEGEPADGTGPMDPGDAVESEDEHIWWRVLRVGEAAFSPASRDEWGVWVTAFAPVPRGDSGVAAGVVGVDVDAEAWQRDVMRRQLFFHALSFAVAGLWAGAVAGQRGSWRWGRKMEALSRRLEIEEARTRRVMEVMPHGLLVADQEGRILYTNTALDALAGASPGEMAGAILGDRLRTTAAPGPDSVEGELLSPAGAVPVEIRLAVNGGGDGRLVYTIADIRDRRRRDAESARRRSEVDRINRCLAGQGDDFAANLDRLVGLAREISGAGDAAYQRLHADGGELLPEPAWAAGAARALIASGEAFLRVVEPCADEARGQGGEGRRTSPAMVWAFLVANEAGAAGALCMGYRGGVEIDEGTRAGLELIASAIGREEVLEGNRARLRGAARDMELEKGRLAALLSQLDGAVLFEDSDRRLVWVNAAAVRFFGDGATAGGDGARLVDSMAGLFVAPEEFAARVDDLMLQGRNAAEDLEMLDGRILLRSFTQVRAADAGLDGYLWHYRDVTGERRAARIFAAVAGLGGTLLSARMDGQDWTQILTTLGRSAGADRAYVFRHFRDVGGVWRISQLAEWNSGAAPAQIDNPALQNLPLAEAGFARWHEAMVEDDLIMGPVAEFPPGERAALEAQGILSLLVVPVKVNGEPWGLLGFDACRTVREWADWEVALLRSVATTLGLRVAQLEREGALRLARDEAEAANRAKSAFLATMSHEIRTPLNAVIGTACLFDESTLDPQQRDHVRTILGSSQALLDLINNILDYSKIESGKLELETAPFYLSAICSQACEILRTAARGKGIELRSRASAAAHDHFLGDPTRLRQVLINLLGNAVKFTQAGGVTLALEVGAEADAQGRLPVTLSVADTGIGMEPEVRQRLFQPFVQGDATTTRKFGGTGLGLVITRRLVETMGGEIQVESRPGEGSVFTVSLSLETGRAQASRAPVPVRLDLPTGLRALVVEPAAVDGSTLRDWLSAWGVDVISAGDEAGALHLLREQRCDFVLLDQPSIGSVDAEAWARIAGGAIARPPVVIVLGNDPVIPAGLRDVCRAIMLKPLWPEPLRQKLAECLRTRVTDPVAAALPSAEGLTEPEALRVLVAEDNLQNQKVVMLMMRRHGLVPTLANNGLEAVAAAEREEFDLIMLDMQMPEMDGLEAARRICERHPSPADRPLLAAFTANVFSEEREAARKAGMPHFISKPMTSDQLAEVLRIAAEHRALRSRRRGARESS